MEETRKSRSLLRCKSQEELSQVLDEIIQEANCNAGIEENKRQSEVSDVQKSSHSENQVHDVGFDLPEYLKETETDNPYEGMTAQEIESLIEDAASAAAANAVEAECSNLVRMADEAVTQQQEYLEWLYLGTLGW